MSLPATLRFICNHPLTRDARAAALVRYLRWQVGSRLVSGAVACPFVEGTRLLVQPGMFGATGNIYCGLHEFEDMALVLHTLRPNDLFVDIGANVGSYSVLAAGVCGASTIAVEPAPAAYQALLDNIGLNGLCDFVTVLNAGLGAEAGEIEFSRSLDTVNHVLAPEEQDSDDTVLVLLETLDGVLAGRSPVLIKMDVEGYETEVVRGGAQTLASPGLLAVLMELNGSGARYGFDEDALHRDMLGRGFTPCAYDPFVRRLTPAVAITPGNTLYVRDLPALAARVEAARPVKVLDREF